MTRSKLVIGLYLFLVFVSGAAVGAFGHRLYMVNTVIADRAKSHRPTPEEYRKKLVQEMQVRLHLSEPQVVQLNAVLDDTRNRYHEFHEKTNPELKAIQQVQVDKINAMLDAGQRQEYAKFLEEREKAQKNQKKDKGHGGGY